MLDYYPIYREMGGILEVYCVVAVVVLVFAWWLIWRRKW